MLNKPDMLSSARMFLLALGLSASVAGGAQVKAPQIFGGRTLMDAHNAYPEDGKYGDRLARAIATKLVPLVIEQDVAFDAHGRKSVVSHDAVLDGTEPTLESHFFARIKPTMEAALAADEKDRWPLVVLHLDFKTNERQHHRAVWDLLAEHRSWLMTSSLDAPAGGASALTPGPLLVLTENGANQETDFTEWAAAAGQHRVFGTIPGPSIPAAADGVERARLLASMPAQQLIAAGATSYRRWVNFPWGVIEAGGPPKAGEWNADDQSRLDRVVSQAHDKGLFIRFYTLNGHPGPDNRGWSPGYNFGSLDAVRLRWRAAIHSRVDLIATDQYEEFSAFLQSVH